MCWLREPPRQSVSRQFYDFLKDSRVTHIVAVADKGKPVSVPENPRVTNTSINFKSQRQLHTLFWFGIGKECSCCHSYLSSRISQS